MLDAELLQILNQIPGAIEKAFTAFIERHPGHANQKTHGNRFGAGQAKESLRRLKDDKGAREAYKESHRKRGQGAGDSTSPENLRKMADKLAKESPYEYSDQDTRSKKLRQVADLMDKTRSYEKDFGKTEHNKGLIDLSNKAIKDKLKELGLDSPTPKPRSPQNKGPKTLDDVLQGLDLQHDKIKAFQRIYSAPKSEQSKLMSEFLSHTKKISRESGRRSYDIAHGRRT